MIHLTQQQHQPAHNILDLTVIHETDHQGHMNYVICAYQFLWWVFKEIKLECADA